MSRNCLVLAALALACLSYGGTNAQDKKDDAGKGGTGGTGSSLNQGVYTGKITRVDADKRTIELGDLMSQGGTTGKGATGKGVTGGDKGTTGGDKGTTGGDKGGTGTIGGDKGTGTNKKMMFTLDLNAKISLDGKEATFKDLKEGYWARVHTDRSGKGATGGTGGTTGGDKGTTGKGATGGNKGTTGGDKGTTGGDKGGTGTTGQNMKATRIEAFTKRPTDTGTGKIGRTDADRDR